MKTLPSPLKMTLPKLTKFPLPQFKTISSSPRCFSTSHFQSNQNAFGVNLVSPATHEELFGKTQSPNVLSDEPLQSALAHLSEFAIKPSKSVTEDNVDLPMPKLYGTVEEHFFKIGQDQIQPYLNLIERFQENFSFLPKLPTGSEWAFEPGWTQYKSDGSCQKVPCPQEDLLVFDVEVCVKEGQWPVIATALSDRAWYSWCSPRLTASESASDGPRVRLDDLIHMEGSNAARLIIGHNVSYDRARIREQYELVCSKTRFLDTMSCTSWSTG